MLATTGKGDAPKSSGHTVDSPKLSGHTKILSIEREYISITANLHTIAESDELKEHLAVFYAAQAFLAERVPKPEDEA